MTPYVIGLRRGAPVGNTNNKGKTKQAKVEKSQSGESATLTSTAAKTRKAMAKKGSGLRAQGEARPPK